MWALGLEGPASGERVLVYVMVTERGSPAKYDDCEGVTTTRTGESSVAVKPGICEDGSWRMFLEEPY